MGCSMRWLWVLGLAGCVRSGTLVAGVTALPSTRPLPPDPADWLVSSWREASGCDYIDKDFRISDLIDQARGRDDALIDVTIETIQEIDWVKTGLGAQATRIRGYCYRVRGLGVSLRAPIATPEPASAAGRPAAIRTEAGCLDGETCCMMCSNSKPCGDRCIGKGETCDEPPGCACQRADICAP